MSVCGEMASEPLSAVLLLGLGYDCLSVSPPALPLVKWVIRTVPEASTRKAAEAALAARSAAEVSSVLREVVGGTMLGAAWLTLCITTLEMARARAAPS